MSTANNKIHNRTQRPGRPAIRRFAASIMSALFDFLVVFGIGVIASAGLLYFGKMMWWVYVQTPVGQNYAALFAERTAAASAFYSQDILRLALKINVFITQMALAVALAGQMLFLTSAFYTGRDLSNRVFFWILPFTAVMAMMLQRTFGLQSFSSFMISCLPSALLLDSSIRLTSEILPDGLLLRGIYRMGYWFNCVLFKNCEL